MLSSCQLGSWPSIAAAPSHPAPGTTATANRRPFSKVEDPTQLLLVDGRSCKLHRNAEQHAALERGDGLIPWNGAQVGGGGRVCTLVALPLSPLISSEQLTACMHSVLGPSHHTAARLINLLHTNPPETLLALGRTT
jgi:hypothetical protein